MRFLDCRHGPAARPAALCLALTGSLLTEGCYHSGEAVPEGLSGTEQVNVGYGSQRRGAISGAISSMSAEELERTQVATMEKLLVGRVPGLQVIRRGSEILLRIRGAGEPHVVIDGMASTTRDLLALPPETVGSIDVRKDGGAAVYGFRAANGVILVTTKRAR